MWGATKSLNLALSVVAPLRAYALGLKGIIVSANGARIALGAVFTLLKRFGPTAGLFAVMEVWNRWNDSIKQTQERLNRLDKDGLEKRLGEAQKKD